MAHSAPFQPELACRCADARKFPSPGREGQGGGGQHRARLKDEPHKIWRPSPYRPTVHFGTISPDSSDVAILQSGCRGRLSSRGWWGRRRRCGNGSTSEKGVDFIALLMVCGNGSTSEKGVPVRESVGKVGGDALRRWQMRKKSEPEPEEEKNSLPRLHCLELPQETCDSTTGVVLFNVFNAQLSSVDGCFKVFPQSFRRFRPRHLCGWRSLDPLEEGNHARQHIGTIQPPAMHYALTRQPARVTPSLPPPQRPEAY
ncbi:hypothetical protein BD779DRAFT_1476611 [Infundibulicybe gibba]|nr:hypothetical protein BD779DRAFT_1476611 [Infundibulicybe gibba]